MTLRSDGMKPPYNKNTYYINVPYNQEAKKLILTYGQKKKVKAGEFLIQAGQEVTVIYYLISGLLVHFAVNDQGTEKVGYINQPGSFTNELLFLVHNGHLLPKRFVMAKVPCEICIIDKLCFEKLRGFPEFETVLMQSLNQKYRILREEVDSFAFNSAQQRLFKLFTASMDHHCFDTKTEWIPLKMSYTQQEMAAIIGVHRVSIARIINNLCHGGFIRVINHRIEVNRSRFEADEE